MDESRMRSLLKLRPIIFGLSIFSLVWTWSNTVERLAIYAAYEYIHVSTFWPYDEVLSASLLLHIVLSALIFSCEWCLKLKGFLGVLCVLSVLCVKW